MLTYMYVLWFSFPYPTVDMTPIQKYVVSLYWSSATGTLMGNADIKISASSLTEVRRAGEVVLLDGSSCRLCRLRQARVIARLK